MANWADFDNDGWLDLFIGNETAKQGRGARPGEPDEIHPCELFRNNGDGTFTDVAAEVGVAAEHYVKGVAWGDYNNDGLSDLYLSLFFEPNLLYRNDGPDTNTGKWRFTEVSRDARLYGSKDSFPPWFWDYDNDGWLDLWVSGNTLNTMGELASAYLNLPAASKVGRSWLYKNNGDGTFTDVSTAANAKQVITVMGSNFGDLDNDGYEDAYFGNGNMRHRCVMPNQMIRNVNGMSFQDVTTSGGFGNWRRGHGIAFGDIDNDGDQDIYEVMGGAVSNDISPNTLYENPGHGNHWITLRLQGVKSNRSAFGTRVKVVIEEDGRPREIHRSVSTGGCFGSNSLQQEIGLGQATKIATIEIFWPASKQRQRFENVEMDRIYHLKEGDAELTPVELKTFRLGGGNRDDA